MEETLHRRRIAVIGSTGSMGRQALDVIARFPDLLQAEALAANSNAELLIEQARAFRPNIVVAVSDEAYRTVKEALHDTGIKVFGGEESLCDVCAMSCIDMVLACIVGIAGLRPVFRALDAGTKVALANKETLVVAGDLMMRTARLRNTAILPVDSEHSAIFQSLAGETSNRIEKILLTASGGPFRGRKRAELEKATKDEALKHPSWTMGPKVTVDSATLMNKGLEVIEASWLFGIPVGKIEVLVHPQSVIHSMVQFEDGSVKAQLGVPDMRLPIQYALTYPCRLQSGLPRLDFNACRQLTFEQPDRETFPCLDMACRAALKGGNMPCVMNAANETAVGWFLQDKVTFGDIPAIVEKALAHADFCRPQTVDEYMAVDRETKERLAAEYRQTAR